METKKVVINACFGGFSLSPAAIARMAELQGRSCFFFIQPLEGGKFKPYHQVTQQEAESSFMFSAFDVPDPQRFDTSLMWHSMSQEERQAANREYEKHTLDSRPDKRDDPLLVRVVEELGDKANGRCAQLRVVEIPSDVEFVIEEYDGNEHVAEAHQTWS
jgi:hypothetical protein